jgi:subtilisin family serine protease
MIKRYHFVVVTFFIIALLVFSFPIIEAKKDSNPVKKIGKGNSNIKRFVANNQSEYDLAIKNGCELINEGKKIYVFLCEEKIGKEISLDEDVEVYGLDSYANDAVESELLGIAGFTGEGIRIAVLDTGYDYTHPDLASSYVGGYDFVNKDNNPIDDNGHGSHVAGLIASDGNLDRAKGIAPDAEIVSGKVLNQYNTGFLTDVSNAIYWAVDEYDVDVISISIGSSESYYYNCDGNYGYLVNAINYAHAHDVNVVIAAGNQGGPVTSPGCIADSFTVGSVDNELVVSSFSGRGSLVDIYAPGDNLYSTLRNPGYGYKTGTSMATPIVSGAIALLREKDNTFNYHYYESSLVNNAKYVPSPYGGNVAVLDVLASINRVPFEVDSTAPAINYIDYDSTKSTVDIHFNTDEISRYRINYGLSDNYGRSIQGFEYSNTHNIHLSWLQKGNRYHYQLVVEDIYGNSYISQDMTFDTKILDGIVADFNFDNGASGISNEIVSGDIDYVQMTNNIYARFEDDFIALSESEDLMFHEYTFSAWIRPSDNQNEISNLFNIGSQQHLMLTRTTDGQDWNINQKYFSNGNGCGTDVNYFPDDNAWHQLTFTYKFGGDIEYYLDGQLIETGNCGTELYIDSLVDDTNYRALIGAYNSTGDYAFDGDIDEILIVNRAISGNEAAELYDFKKEIFLFSKPEVRYMVDNGEIVLFWDSEIGANYKVYYKDNMIDSNWNYIGLFEGTGNVIEYRELANQQMRFYKVEVL